MPEGNINEKIYSPELSTLKDNQIEEISISSFSKKLNNHIQMNKTEEIKLKTLKKHLKKIENNKNFSVVHWNCNGIKSKIEELIVFCNENKPDFISLNEIKCNQMEANNNLNIKNYNYLHKTRNNNLGGGVAILIKNTIVFEKLDLDVINSEIIGIKIELKNKIKLHLFSYYNPPSSMLDPKIFENIEEKYEHYLICGDLNARSTILGCNGDNNNGSILESVVINRNGLILNEGKESTFHIQSQNYHEKLDYIFGSPFFANKLSNYRVLKEGLDSDHSPIIANFNFSNKLKQFEADPYEVYNYKKINWNNFSNGLDNHEESSFYSLNVKNHNENLMNIINRNIEISIPKIKIRNKLNYTNKLPEHIVKLIKEKNKLKSLFSREKNQDNKISRRNEYYRIKSIVEEEIIKNKQEEMISFLERLNKTPVSTIKYSINHIKLI